MQADGRFIENKEGVCQARAETGREIDPLRFPAREGAGGTIEIEIAEPDLAQKAEPVDDFLVQHRRGFVLAANFDGLDKGVEFVDGELPEFGQAASRHSKSERLGLQPGPTAGLAQSVAAVAAQEDAHVHLVGARLEPVEETAHAVPDAMLPGVFGITAFAFEDPLLIGGIHLVVGRHDAEAAGSRAALEVLLALVVGVSLEGTHEPLGDR